MTVSGIDCIGVERSRHPPGRQISFNRRRRGEFHGKTAWSWYADFHKPTWINRGKVAGEDSRDVTPVGRLAPTTLPVRAELAIGEAGLRDRSAIQHQIGRANELWRF